MFIVFLIVGIPSLIVLEQDRMNDLKSLDRYLEYKFLQSESKTTRQIVVSEGQLRTLSPIYLMRIEIEPATRSTVILKGEGKLLALIYDKLYRVNVKKYEYLEKGGK